MVLCMLLGPQGCRVISFRWHALNGSDRARGSQAELYVHIETTAKAFICPVSVVVI